MDEGQREEVAVEERTIVEEGHDKEDADDEETMMEGIQLSKDAVKAITCKSSVSNNNGTLSGEQGKKCVKKQATVGSKYVRVKHKCPFPSCKSKVYHLPRHMRLSHGWNRDDALNVVSTFGLRKNRSKRENNKTQKKYMCSVDECKSVVIKIHNHLTDVHKATRGSKEYKRLLEKAIEYDPIVISSDNSLSEDSDSSYEYRMWRKELKKEQENEREERLYNQVYSSDEEVFGTPTPAIKKKECGKKANVKEHPSIFRNDSEDEWDDEEDNDDGSSAKKYKVCCKTGNCKEHPSIFRNDREDEGDDDEDYPDDDDDEDFTITGTAIQDQGRASSSSELNESPVYKDPPKGNGDFNGGSEEELFPNDDPVSTNMDDVSESIFKDFESWLQGPDGGRKDSRCAQQCSRQIQVVITYIDPENRKLIKLFDKGVLRDKWLVVFEKSRQPGTVKSYLGALHRFYAFLKCEPVDIPGIDRTSGIFETLCEQMKMWNKSCAKQVKTRFWDKRMEDISNLRTPEQVKQFDTSDVAREAVKILGEFEESPEHVMLSHTQYTTVRDYLLTILCINNGSRAGALANMTLEEFRAAKRHDSEYLVNVKKHKTFATHGPAHIVFSLSLFKWTEIFISKCRNALGDVDTTNASPVFLTWSQKGMTSSHIGRQIDSCWGKTFGREAASGGATAFRKAVVSAVEEYNDEIREDLATLMKHHKTTADQYYLLRRQAKSAINASRQVTQIMHTSQQSSRHKWSDEEEQVLKKLFSKQIENCSISIHEVKEISQKDPLLSDMPLMVIRNKVRSFFKTKEDTAVLPKELETSDQRCERLGLSVDKTRSGRKQQNDDMEYTPSIQLSASESTTTTTTRKSTILTAKEIALFQELFKELIANKRPIKRDFVTSQIEKHKELKHILKKCTPLQLADKVRTERKIAARQ
ncbi:Hypothetical predicted protein [Paramuricea clavata]|uniref:Uncharacterized protein n=1 Tax=Paramuricea clavata TaxID=317549 RepID=A0A6S7GCL2_PARCT|nr:Hypothetical predicted protein [Paramuricea clavata]